MGLHNLSQSKASCWPAVEKGARKRKGRGGEERRGEEQKGAERREEEERKKRGERREERKCYGEATGNVSARVRKVYGK